MKQRYFFLICFLLYSFSSFSQKKDEYHIETFKKHSDFVYGVAFSLDGKQFVSASKDKTSILWDIETGEALSIMTNHSAEVRGVNFIPNSDKFITGSGSSFKLWKNNGEFISILGGHHTYIWTFEIGKDGKYMVSGSFDKSPILWDLHTREKIHHFEGHKKSVLAVCLSPNAKYIASGSLDETIKIWDIESKKNILTLDGHSDNIYSLCFSHTGEYLLSASRDRTVKLWDVSSGQYVKTYLKHSNGVMKAIFTPDDNHIITASLDGTINIIEVKTGKVVYSFVDHLGPVNSITLSADGKYLLSCGNDKTVILWNFSKKIFAEFAFPNELQADIDDSYLFRDRKKGEDKEHYIARQAKAEKYLNELHNKYYLKYIAQLQDLAFEE